MSMTMTQKILAAHAGLSEVSPGQLIETDVDLVLGNDITSSLAIEAMEEAGLDRVFDPDKIALVLDHFTPNRDVKAARQSSVTRSFAQKHGIAHFYDVGRAGIEHALLPERGLTAPGELIIGADSHTCTYGALNAFSTGVGSTDMAAAMATGRCWFRVPEALSVVLRGTLPPFVTGKDVILHLIAWLGVDGAWYQSLEFSGPGVAALSIDDRFTIANMVIECGAKNGLFPCDDVTRAYLYGRVTRPFREVMPDDGASYVRTLTVDLSALEPLVACPSLPSNVAPVGTLNGVKVDQVVIGSCTNGHLSDLRAAAVILKGQQVAHGVRCLVIPATQEIYLQAAREGLLATFVEAGAAVSAPTCGPCLGGHMGILDEGEVCLATTNRNFVGRMGHPGSKVYLAGAPVAAATAVAGCITAP